MRSRRLAVVLALTGALTCVIPTALAAPSVATPHSVLSEINHIRAAHGLPALRVSSALEVAARGHSREMGRLGYFRHGSADGTSFWQRIRRSYRSSGYRYWSVGENLLRSSGKLSAEGAVSMWMHSPPHRKNLLSRTWKEIGISIVHVAHAPGVFHGQKVTLVSADFGTRR